MPIKEVITQIIKEIIGEIPKQHEIKFLNDPKLGDYASNIAFILSQSENKTPLEIAQELRPKLASYAIFKEVNVASPGFINFVLSREFLLKNLAEAKKDNYGKNDLGRGQRVLVEYISANPTGPLNVVQARAGAFGNALVNLLKFVNYDVNSEYYINDKGTQIDILYNSLLARIHTLQGKPTPIPENGYPGEYLLNIAQKIIDNNIPEDNWRNFLLDEIISWQKKSLLEMGVKFDNFVQESWYYKLHPIILEKLQPYTYYQNGALWFKSKEFGDTEDRVLITANGRPTYFLTDVSYHYDKFNRGYDLLINIWGPDHHGYIPRMKGALQALGFDPNRLIIIIAQQVSLLRNKEKITMSKRAGEYITLDEVLDEIGPDALKFFLLMRRASQHLEFDLSLAQKTSQENPVYYVQYAYTRINSILRNAQEKQLLLDENPDLNLLTTSYEETLIKLILHFPDIILESALHFEPHHLVYYLLNLANAFHKYYETIRVLDENKSLANARLYLCQIIRQVIKTALTILGISTPERM
ncbi:MAG: arginine--tRNA ligase [candidate division WOR-3 bacterium]|nr:arginine--tRNA ligase [candidate division WOR-3 bacterium]